jgi:hypothetical protein
LHSAGHFHTGQERWQPILKHLQIWSSAINYERVPGNDRHKTQSLIESIEHLALRLPAAVRDGQSSGEDLDATLHLLSTAAHMGSLADAIDDCRDKMNALDWAAWNRNYL